MRIENFPERFQRIVQKLIILLYGNPMWNQKLRKFYKEQYDVEIGIGSYGCFDRHCFPRGTVIGNYCSFAGGVHYLPRNHPINFASQHPMFFNAKIGFIEKDKAEYSYLKIEDDVWIGYNALICKGCTHIGRGAIIGAGSIVTKNVESYTIVVGNPARVLGKRFEAEVCRELDESHWYDLSPEQLKKIVDEADAVGDFVKKASNLHCARRVK